MKRIRTRLQRVAFAALMFFVVAQSSAAAQDLEQKLSDLRDKYTWGSIYLTYIPISDLYDVLSTAVKVREISRQEGQDTVTLLVNFLNSTKKIKLNESVAFIEIDLNRVEAGYKLANSKDGVITKIAWDRQYVIRIAHLCDKLLAGTQFAERAYNSAISGTASILETARAIQAMSENPYVSSEQIIRPLFAFRNLLEVKTDELKAIRQSDAQLFNSLQGFKANFDASYSKQLQQRMRMDNEFQEQMLKKEENNLLLPSVALITSLPPSSTKPAPKPAATSRPAVRN